jgi:hypothetical protein
VGCTLDMHNTDGVGPIVANVVATDFLLACELMCVHTAATAG